MGRGRVLFVATDTLWKWHTLAATNEGPTPYAIFWQQAFRAMTPPRSQIGATNIWLTLDRSRAEVGRAISLHAEVHSTRQTPGGTLHTMLTTQSGKSVPLVLSVDPANPRVHRTDFTCIEPGTHRIQARLPLQKGASKAVHVTIE